MDIRGLTSLRFRLLLSLLFIFLITPPASKAALRFVQGREAHFLAVESLDQVSEGWGPVLKRSGAVTQEMTWKVAKAYPDGSADLEIYFGHRWGDCLRSEWGKARFDSRELLGEVYDRKKLFDWENMNILEELRFVGRALKVRVDPSGRVIQSDGEDSFCRRIFPDNPVLTAWSIARSKSKDVLPDEIGNKLRSYFPGTGRTGNEAIQPTEPFWSPRVKMTVNDSPPGQILLTEVGELVQGSPATPDVSGRNGEDKETAKFWSSILVSSKIEGRYAYTEAGGLPLGIEEEWTVKVSTESVTILGTTLTPLENIHLSFRLLKNRNPGSAPLHELENSLSLEYDAAILPSPGDLNGMLWSATGFWYWSGGNSAYWLEEIGRRLDAGAAVSLEKELVQDPENALARNLLIAYYGSRDGAFMQTLKEDDPSPDRTALRRHYLWLVEKAPRRLLSTYSAPLNSYSDPAAYAQAREAWTRYAKDPGSSVEVLENAVSFFHNEDKAWEMLKFLYNKLEKLKPGDLNEITGRAYVLDSEAREAEPGKMKSKARKALAAWEDVIRKEEARKDQTFPKYWFDSAARAALKAGEPVKAASYAREILKEGNQGPYSFPNEWAEHWHEAHILLAKAALQRNRLDEAASELTLAAQSPGGNNLSRNGPNDYEVPLALLNAGKKESVLAYLKACAAFGEPGPEKAKAWVEAIETGGIPNFKRNRYSETQPFGLRAGVKAPNFALQTLEGREWKLQELKGKIVIVVFWATWCGPCMSEIPHLQKAWEKSKGEKVQILLVSEDPEHRDAILKVIKDRGLTMPVLMDPNGSVKSAYGVGGIPHLVVIDGKGKISSQHLGFSPDIGETLAYEVKKLGGGGVLPQP